jgi:phage shock protein A
MSDGNNSDFEELERLRALVGPSELSYHALLRDRFEAQRTAQEASAQAGALRGKIVELGVQVSRARQDQEVLLRRAAMTPTRRTVDRIHGRWATSVVPRVKRLTGRST